MNYGFFSLFNQLKNFTVPKGSLLSLKQKVDQLTLSIHHLTSNFTITW